MDTLEQRNSRHRARRLKRNSQNEGTVVTQEQTKSNIIIIFLEAKKNSFLVNKHYVRSKNCHIKGTGSCPL